jgi:hypothetical protein
MALRTGGLRIAPAWFLAVVTGIALLPAALASDRTSENSACLQFDPLVDTAYLSAEPACATPRPLLPRHDGGIKRPDAGRPPYDGGKLPIDSGKY